MEFFKYQHIEKLESPEVDGLAIGECWAFPKLDGTNCQVFIGDDGTIRCGSRNRELTPDFDHFGFYEYIQSNTAIQKFLKANPNLKLFGEFLVPHTFKAYQEGAWRRFYVFDVVNDGMEYVHYEKYKLWLEEYGIDFIPPICKINNPSKERLYGLLDKSVYLVKDGEGAGEGIVVKNYHFKNKYGRVVWAKIVRNDFKTKHNLRQVSEVKEKKILEEEIAIKYVTEHLVEKVFAKVSGEDGWHSKKIPQFLNTVYYDIVREDMWDIIKTNKRPVIDFGLLMKFIFNQVKELKKDVF